MDKNEIIAVTMIRENLDDISEYPLACGYSMRLFRPGDEETWDRIQIDCYPGENRKPGLFNKELGFDMPAVLQRCYFLVSPSGENVGSITAWYEHLDPSRKGWGLIHWVAVTAEHRGKQLAKAMITVALNRLVELGHTKVMLRTQTHRIPAIKTYMDLGFVPDMSAENAQAGWSKVAKTLPKCNKFL